MEHSYSFNDLQSKTGIPSATLARRLNQYTDEGYISKVDEGGHARWKLTAKGTVYASEKQT
jgi:DNA-binding HxlR family transcriptional regulator